MSRGLEATKIAESALNALRPAQLHPVKTESKAEPLNKSLNTTMQVNTPRNISTNLSPYEAANNLSFALENDIVSGVEDQTKEIKINQIKTTSNVLINLEEEEMNLDNGLKFEEPVSAPVAQNMETLFKLQKKISSKAVEFEESVRDVQVNEAPIALNAISVNTSLPKSTQQISDRKDATDGNGVSPKSQNVEVSLNIEKLKIVENEINKKDVANTNLNNDSPGTKNIDNTSLQFNDDLDDDFDDTFVSSDTTGGFEEMLA